MTLSLPTRPWSLLKLAVALLIVEVTGRVVAGYVNYFPANFHADFLLGRENYFFRDYQFAFYPHLVVGPFSLIAGLLLLSDHFRRRWPRWHARLGRAHTLCVLLILVPSGLWMGLYARGGMPSTISFTLLATLAGFCSAMGWRTALLRDFRGHRLWMMRCYVLLCSAVVTRLLGGLFIVTMISEEWTLHVSSWASWLIPWLVFEVSQHHWRRSQSWGRLHPRSHRHARS